MTTLFLDPVNRSALAVAMVREMQAILTDWLADASDPGVVWSDDTAERFRALVETVNTLAAEYWPETATTNGLKALLAKNNVTAAEMEDLNDAELLALWYDTWYALTQGVPEFDRQIIRRADTGSVIKDIGLITNPALNRTTYYLITADAEQPAQDVLDAVHAALNTRRKPAHIDYVKGDPTVRYYQVRAVVRYIGDGPQEEIEANLAAAVIALLKFDQGIYDGNLARRMWPADDDPNDDIDGVQDIAVTLHESTGLDGQGERQYRDNGVAELPAGESTVYALAAGPLTMQALT